MNDHVQSQERRLIVHPGPCLHIRNPDSTQTQLCCLLQEELSPRHSRYERQFPSKCQQHTAPVKPASHCHVAMAADGTVACWRDTDLKLKALLYWKAKDSHHSHIEMDCTEVKCQGGSSHSLKETCKSNSGQCRAVVEESCTHQPVGTPP